MPTFSDINLESDSISNNDLSYDIDAIRLSLFTIFSTRSGERLFNPSFGANLESLLFEPMDETTSFYLKNILINSIETWDSRIVVDKVKTQVSPNYDKQVYNITFCYSIPSINIYDTLNFNMSKDR